MADLELNMESVAPVADHDLRESLGTMADLEFMESGGPVADLELNMESVVPVADVNYVESGA